MRHAVLVVGTSLLFAAGCRDCEGVGTIAPQGVIEPTIYDFGPVTTGGNTSGRCTSASSSTLPRQRPRARIHANKIAMGRLTATLRAAIDKLKRTASISAGLSI